jgi:hypothetical protein
MDNYLIWIGKFMPFFLNRLCHTSNFFRPPPLGNSSVCQKSEATTGDALWLKIAEFSPCKSYSMYSDETVRRPDSYSLRQRICCFNLRERLLFFRLILLYACVGVALNSLGVQCIINSKIAAHLTAVLRPCLVAKNFAKFFNILRHIESLDAYMTH